MSGATGVEDAPAPVPASAPVRSDAAGPAVAAVNPGMSGMLCMALAVTCFSGMAVCVKLLGSGIPAHEKIFVRTVVTVPVILWMLRSAGISPWGKDRRLLLARGIMGFLSMLAYFAALAALPLGNATLLTNTSPIFATLFASRFLGERAARGAWLASGVCLLGVALIARPTVHAPLLASLLALGSAALNGGTYTVVRASARREHHLVIVLALVAVSLPLSGLLSLAHWVSPTGAQWGLIAAMTVLSIVAQILMTMGMQRETLSRATHMFFLGVVLLLTYDQVRGETPFQLLDWAGAALILGSIVALTASRHRASARDAAAAAEADAAEASY